MKRIAATYYGQVVAFLVPLKDLEQAEKNGAISKSEEMSLSDFRLHLTECWERLQMDVDCIYITYHTRRVIAFVSPRFTNYLPIPISEVAHKLLIINSGLIQVGSLLKEKC
ncbi:MAG: prevent-host-death family protein [Dolichospermum sp.]